MSAASGPLWPASQTRTGALTMRSIWQRRLSTAALTLAVLVVPAFAAEGGKKGPLEAIFIGQMVALMITGRLLGELMLRLRQPAVMGQLIAGLVLGPSLFGLLLPDLQHALFPKNPD